MFPPTDVWIAAMVRSVKEVIEPAIDQKNTLARIQVSMLHEQLAQLARQIDHLSAYEAAEYQSALLLAADMLQAAEGGVLTQKQSGELRVSTDRAASARAQAERRSATREIGFACEALISAAGMDGTALCKRRLSLLAIADGKRIAGTELRRLDPNLDLTAVIDEFGAST